MYSQRCFTVLYRRDFDLILKPTGPSLWEFGCLTGAMFTLCTEFSNADFTQREVIFLFLPEGRVVMLLHVFLCNYLLESVAIVNMVSPKVRAEVPSVYFFWVLKSIENFLL